MTGPTRPSVPPGRAELRDAQVSANELRRLVAEQHEIDRQLSEWRKRMERLHSQPEKEPKR